MNSCDCTPVVRTAGLYHSQFCTASPNQPYGKRTAEKRKRATALAKATAHPVILSTDPEYLDAWSDLAYEQGSGK